MSEEDEEDIKCPSYVFIKKGVDGEWQLEIPYEYQDEFKPIRKKTYDRWLREKLENPTPEDIEDMKEYEVDASEEEN